MSRFIRIGLGAAVLGFVVSPCFYLVLGTLRNVPAGVAVVMLSAVAGAVGLLLRRNLSSPAYRPTRSATLLEWIAAAVVIGFVAISSQLVIVSNAKRFAFNVTLVTVAWIACLPVLMTRRTILDERISRLPLSVSSGVLLFLVLGAAYFVLRYLTVVEHLI